MPASSIRIAFLHIPLALVSSTGWAQQSRFPIQITPSVRARSTVMNFFNLKSIRGNVYIPYKYERNLQALAIGPEIAVGREISLSYTPFLRYGYIHSLYRYNADSTAVALVDKKGLILDQQFWLSKRLHPPSARWYKPVALAVGWGILNTGQKFFLRNPPVTQSIRVETYTADLAARFTSANQKWTGLVAAHYFYEGIARSRAFKMISYSLTVGYRLVPLKGNQEPAKSTL
jgi:hypothetical protein